MAARGAATPPGRGRARPRRRAPPPDRRPRRRRGRAAAASAATSAAGRPRRARPPRPTDVAPRRVAGLEQRGHELHVARAGAERQREPAVARRQEAGRARRTRSPPPAEAERAPPARRGPRRRGRRARGRRRRRRGRAVGGASGGPSGSPVRAIAPHAAQRGRAAWPPVGWRTWRSTTSPPSRDRRPGRDLSVLDAAGAARRPGRRPSPTPTGAPPRPPSCGGCPPSRRRWSTPIRCPAMLAEAVDVCLTDGRRPARALGPGDPPTVATAVAAQPLAAWRWRRSCAPSAGLDVVGRGRGRGGHLRDAARQPGPPRLARPAGPGRATGPGDGPPGGRRAPTATSSSITLDRPEVHNAVDTATRDELVDALDVAAADPSITEVVLSGARARASAPAATSTSSARSPTAPPPSPSAWPATRGWPCTSVAERTTAHLHGACIGAGIEIAGVRRAGRGRARHQVPPARGGHGPGARGGRHGVDRPPHRPAPHRLAGADRRGDRRRDGAGAGDWSTRSGRDPGATGVTGAGRRRREHAVGRAVDDGGLAHVRAEGARGPARRCPPRRGRRWPAAAGAGATGTTGRRPGGRSGLRTARRRRPRPVPPGDLAPVRV